MAGPPVIGVTGPRRLFRWSWWAISWRIRREGGRPLRLTPGTDFRDPRVHGFVISGGRDLDPTLYGSEEVHAHSDPERDQYELEAIEYADRRGLPILGICRGAQLLNVEAGGDLHSDINPLRRHTSRKPHLRPRKHVHVEADSRLARITESEVLMVNSLHHQAVRHTGRDFRVVARDRDDIIQAIEHREHPFRVGVQWHPEYLPWMSAQVRLFAALVATSARWH